MKERLPFAQLAAEFDTPLYIKFTLDGIMWVLYPENAAAVPFENHSQAIEHIDGMIRFLNELYTKKGSITPDHKKHKPVSVLDIYKLLPGTNCNTRA